MSEEDGLGISCLKRKRSVAWNQIKIKNENKIQSNQTTTITINLKKKIIKPPKILQNKQKRLVWSYSALAIVLAWL